LPACGAEGGADRDGPPAYAFIIRSHENTSHWEAKLLRARSHTPLADETASSLQNAYGALYHVMQVRNGGACIGCIAVCAVSLLTTPT